MYKAGVDWNPKQAVLKEIIRKEEMFSKALALCREMHQFVHLSDLSGIQTKTLEDEVWEELTKDDFSVMPTVKDVTIAWNLWHITRIEDLTINLLVNRGNQVLDHKWQERLGVLVTDTGNAMSDEEIIGLSKSLNITELKNYRLEVGKRSRKVMDSLTAMDMKKRVEKEDINRIYTEGGVTNHPDSLWLLDFWAKKDVAGILLMPLTRHQAGHLNDCLKLKTKIKKIKT